MSLNYLKPGGDIQSGVNGCVISVIIVL